MAKVNLVPRPFEPAGNTKPRNEANPFRETFVAGKLRVDDIRTGRQVEKLAQPHKNYGEHGRQRCRKFNRQSMPARIGSTRNQPRESPAATVRE